MATEVTLGGVTVSVVPQRHAYLKYRLGPTITAALKRGEGVAGAEILDVLDEGVYDILCALIPALSSRLPLWQFLGFGSAEALATGEYDETADQSPDIPEIEAALKTALQVNGIDRLLELGKAVIDPRLVKAQVNAAIAEAIDSSTSPSPSGASPSPSSTTTAPTSTESEGSPSPASAA